MKYLIDRKLIPVADGALPEHKPFVELLSFAEVRGRKDPLQVRSPETIRRCKAEIYEEEIAGTLFIPQLKDEDQSRWTGLFFLEKGCLLLVGDVPEMTAALEKINRSSKALKTPGQVLFSLFEFLLQGDEDVIDETDSRLDQMEDMLLRDALSDDFEVQLLQNRKQLTSLNRYYQQLLELLSTLASCPFPSVDKESRRLFGYLKNRVEIYHMEVQKLKEQLESLRDHYQLMHNEHQEEAVRFLTIATSVFMPLTLLTGWYGMNFSTMPELYWKYGYLVVILVAILILAVELFLFKKKKWL